MKLLLLFPLLLASLLLKQGEQAIDMLFLIAEDPTKNIKIICTRQKKIKLVSLRITHRNTHGEFVDICPVPDGVYSRRHFKFDIMVRVGSQEKTIWSIQQKL